MSTKQNVEIEEKNFKEVEQYLKQKVTGNFQVVTLAGIFEIYQQSNGKSIFCTNTRIHKRVVCRYRFMDAKIQRKILF